MAKFKATAKGYYGDVIHDPENEHHVIFEAPDDWCCETGEFKCSWAVRIDDDTEVEPVKQASDDTLAAEAIIEAEAIAAEEVVEPEDINEATGVETL